jgi:hypothetical protein
LFLKYITPSLAQLFFINLGGYKENEFEEYHYKMLAVANKLATKKSKATAFTNIAVLKDESHLDEKYGIDIDDSYKVVDILPEEFKALYTLKLQNQSSTKENPLHIGYFQLKNYKISETNILNKP